MATTEKRGTPNGGMALPKASTLLTYLIYFVPLYIFVFSPLARMFTGDTGEGQQRSGEETGTTHGLARESLVSAEEMRNLSCPEPRFDVHVFSTEPLVVYIPNFLSDREVEHLMELSENRFTPSTVWDGSAVAVDPAVRVSDYALLPADDDTVRCIEARAHAFQGWRPDLAVERPKAQRYGPGGHYVHHYDHVGHGPWATGGRHGKGKTTDRVSTFMVYLYAECVGGGTNFPYLERPADERWCKFVECGEEEKEEEEGVTFKPIRGAAVFWMNLRADGSGYRETFHAGLPVKSGSKVGLNIWSWYQP